MSKNKCPIPNEQRSNAKNPNNAAFKAAQNNRAGQMNPNNWKFTNVASPAPFITNIHTSIVPNNSIFLGAYRIIYDIFDKEPVVDIITLGNRRDVYE